MNSDAITNAPHRAPHPRPLLVPDEEFLPLPPHLEPSTQPLMADLMCGPDEPITKAFVMCGWKAAPIDWAITESHNFADPIFQLAVQNELADAIVIIAALDCSTKSKARELPC